MLVQAFASLLQLRGGDQLAHLPLLDHLGNLLLFNGELEVVGWLAQRT